MTVGRMCVVMMCVLGLTSVASADEKPPEEQEQIVAKAEKVGRARFIDFASELGLPLASLDSLGERIDNARFEADPVELASIAKILGAAERATGKKASLTSEKISAEAAALA